MRKAILKYSTRFLKFIVSHVKEMILSFILSALYYYFLQPQVNDAWGWLLANERILQNGFRSGFVTGTAFKSAQGNWAVTWQIGGEPFIHVVIPFVFVSLSVLGTAILAFYLLGKWRSFERVKGIWTYRGQPKSFWKYVSLSFVVALVVVSLVGVVGTRVGPNYIVPAEPSKGLGIDMHITFDLKTTVTHKAVLIVNPSVIEKGNMTGLFSCVIAPPENAPWNITDVDLSTIVLNGTMKPFSAFLHSDDNETASVLVQFEKNQLRYVFGDADYLGVGIVTLSVDGSLKNGDYFTGSSQLEVVE